MDNINNEVEAMIEAAVNEYDSLPEVEQVENFEKICALVWRLEQMRFPHDTVH